MGIIDISNFITILLLKMMFNYDMMNSNPTACWPISFYTAQYL